MWLSVTAQTALRAVLHIAAHSEEGPVRADDIAAEIGCPRNYLSKTLHALARVGVLRSTRGPRGGFQLVPPPEKLTLSQVVDPFAQSGERLCLLGRDRCSSSHACPMHDRWSRVASEVEEFFDQTTVADYLRRAPPSRTA